MNAAYAVGDGLPDLLNVVDLGAGRTGIITHVTRGETIELALSEYRDGVGTRTMRVLQSLSFGE